MKPRDFNPGDRVRHIKTGHIYTFHAHPSSQDFPGSRYVRNEHGGILEFRADELEPVDTTPPPTDLTPERLDQIEKAAKKATPGPWHVGEHLGDIAIRDAGNPIVFAASYAQGGFLDVTDEDAEHIANMDPATTLALITKVRELDDAVFARDMFIDRVWARVTDEARHHKREDCGEDDCEAHDNCTTCWRRWPCPIVEAAGFDRPDELRNES